MSFGTKTILGIGKQFSRYGVVGIINTLAGGMCIMGAFALSHNMIASNMLGYGIGFILSYFLNRFWVFHDIGSHSWSDRKSFWRFGFVVVCSYTVNLALVLFLNKELEINAYIAQFCGLAVYVLLGFLGSRYIAFK